MSNIVEQIEREELARVSPEETRQIPDFGPGDSVKVHVRVIEGGKERIQVFEGIVLGVKEGGLRSAFTVRKISHGIGVERRFPMFSPRLAKIEVVRRGKVRRAKLYYLREKIGKATRVKERREKR
jgi:large subunit ribosomal protein L19